MLSSLSSTIITVFDIADLLKQATAQHAACADSLRRRSTKASADPLLKRKYAAALLTPAANLPKASGAQSFAAIAVESASMRSAGAVAIPTPRRSWSRAQRSPHPAHSTHAGPSRGMGGKFGIGSARESDIGEDRHLEQAGDQCRISWTLRAVDHEARARERRKAGGDRGVAVEVVHPGRAPAEQHRIDPCIQP